MGIRFLCPNGHKLNVKSFLAGKRGICPQCDAKFLVPEVSGGQADVLDAEASGEKAVDSGEVSPHGFSAAPLPPPMPTDAVESQQAANVQHPAAEVWYVRSATGEQFGPANTEVMRGWVADGRVPVDSWVWRTGWPEWKTGEQAITFLGGPPELPGPAPNPPLPETLPVASQSNLPIENSSDDSLTAPAPEPVRPTIHYQNSRRSRKERARKLTFILGGVVLLLFVALVVVLVKNNR